MNTGSIAAALKTKGLRIKLIIIGEFAVCDRKQNKFEDVENIVLKMIALIYLAACEQSQRILSVSSV